MISDGLSASGFTSPRRGEVGLRSNPGEGAMLTLRDLNPSPDLLRKSTSSYGRGDHGTSAHG
jgi:hypothetical protein